MGNLCSCCSSLGDETPDLQENPRCKRDGVSGLKQKTPLKSLLLLSAHKRDWGAVSPKWASKHPSYIADSPVSETTDLRMPELGDFQERTSQPSINDMPAESITGDISALDSPSSSLSYESMECSNSSYSPMIMVSVVIVIWNPHSNSNPLCFRKFEQNGGFQLTITTDVQKCE